MALLVGGQKDEIHRCMFIKSAAESKRSKSNTIMNNVLQTYCDWLVGTEDRKPRLPDCAEGAPGFSWYTITYSLRALIGASRTLSHAPYADTAFRYMDAYTSEQLPQGGFTANFRGTPTSRLTREAYHEILRAGCVNLADNGSNVTCLVQAAGIADAARRERYLNAARRWFDEWVPLWALTEDPAGGSSFWTGHYVPQDPAVPILREGIYGNGIWHGHKINAPYTMATCNLATSLSVYFKATGEAEYRRQAEACGRFLCKYWLDDGRPINLSVYPMQRREVVMDFARIFYLLEGLCWIHSVAQDADIKQQIEKRLHEWMFAPEGILSLWDGNWFTFGGTAHAPLAGLEPESLRSSKIDVGFFWEMAKAAGIPYAFSYYLHHIGDAREIREKLECGMKFLCDPQRAKMIGIMSDIHESYGSHAVQATGFGGLSLLEGISPGTGFNA